VPVKIPPIVNQIRIVPKLGGDLRVILKKIVKLANFVAQAIVIAPSRWRGYKERESESQRKKYR
jgi:hypothetical protein